VTHDQLVAEIQSRASRRAVLSHYCRDSRRCDGDPGVPDLLLAGLFGAAFVEVKTGADKLKPDQVTWRHTLIAAGQVYEVMHAADLADGGALNMLLLSLAEGITP
jgi:hypothetical protein